MRMDDLLWLTRIVTTGYRRTMRPIRHLPKSVDGLKKAVERKFAFYHTLCGLVAALPDLGTRESSECGACDLLYDEQQKKKESASIFSPGIGPMPASPLSVDLSDWDQIYPESAPGARSMKPPSPEPLTFEVLCRRLALEPTSDPEGKLGNLERDIREVLTPEERASAGTILGMVKMFPAGEPLVQMVYRLCHELTWHRASAAAST